MLNSEALRYESAFQKASFLSNVLTYNLEKDFTLKQNQILKNMTKDELNAQIKKLMDINKLTTVVVGDRTVIEMQMEKQSKDAKNKEVLNKVKLKKITVD